MAETKQLGILRFIYEKQNEKGYPPTVREIGEAVGLSSTSTVHGHIDRLEKHGLLHKDPTKPRAIEITEKGLRALSWIWFLLIGLVIGLAAGMVISRFT
ncbi:LexA family protein, partial [Oenococcus oeni]|uniref:LexA family protein n=1 Tax=Oenococcus oeni TaxID=1247 RepID=UPI000B27C030